MARFKPGTEVALREPLRRNRWHKHGRVRLRRGAHGRVTASNRHWRKGLRYDVKFRRRARQELPVKSVPARLLARRVTARTLLAVVALCALAAVLLAVTPLDR